MPNLAQIGQAVAEIWPFFHYLRWRLSDILDLLYACLDHPRRVSGGLCQCAEFGV